MRGQRMLPGTIDGMKHVCYFRHALALDERRIKFLPEYTYGGSTQPQRCATMDGNHDVFDPNTQDAKKDDQRTGPSPTENLDVSDVKLQEEYPQSLEVWFAGTHSDM